MKQTIAVLALLVLLVGTSRAQVGFGLTGGVNFATVGGTDATPNAKNLTGFAAGAYLDISVPFLISVQPEVLYSVKGYTAEANFVILGNSYTAKGTATLNYLEIPVLVKYSFPVPVLKPTLYAGPAMGILLSAKMKTELTGQPTQETDIKDNTNSPDWGGVVGASVHLLAVNVTARYTFGLTTLDKSGQAKVYNRVWSIMLELPM